MSLLDVVELFIRQSSDGSARGPTLGDRRAHPRHTVYELDWLQTIRLKNGPPVSLVDLSAGGALFETSLRLRPGSTAALRIAGRDLVETTAAFEVLRSEISSLAPGPVYRAACLFDRALALPDPTRSQNVPEDPHHNDAASGRMPGAAAAELGDVLQMLRAEAIRREGESLGEHLRALMADVAPPLRRGDSPDAILAFIEQRLRQVLARHRRGADSVALDFD
jgi:hypothetical protein